MWGKRIKQSVLWKRNPEDNNQIQVPLFPVMEEEHQETIQIVQQHSKLDDNNNEEDDNDTKLPATQESSDLTE